MPTYPLPYRIHDFLNRQIAWAKTVLNELDAFCAMTDDGDFDEIATHQARREKETRAMAREYNGLLQEWSRATDLSAELREAVARHSREAGDLLEQVRSRYEEAADAAQRLKSQNHQALNDLRRGRRSVNIYTPDVVPTPEFIDRET